MTPVQVRSQIDAAIARTIEIGASVHQNNPSVTNDGGVVTIGNLPGSSIGLKNIPYTTCYAELDRNKAYHIKLPDGGLLIFQYTFTNNTLSKHRLCYFPCPILPSIEEAPELYDRDELYGDLIVERIVRFPIRFDFDPANYKKAIHPHSHLTLGQFEHCRIPVASAMEPYAFLLFVVRNFYHLLYRKNQNKFERKVRRFRPDVCITDAESGLCHMVVR